MDETIHCIIIWAVITIITGLIAVGVYIWLSRAARFENRKKEIAMGLVVCVLAVAGTMFLPVLFSKMDLRMLGKHVIGALNESENNACPMFLKPFSYFLAKKSGNIIAISFLISTSIITFTALIISRIREPKKNAVIDYDRTRLFDYDESIVENLNKKK